MITWQATIKKRGNEYIITPLYSMPNVTINVFWEYKS